MLFNSYVFIFVFLPITFLITFAFSKISKNSFVFLLALASCIFYAHWNPKFLILLLASAITNFILSLLIYKSESQDIKRKILILAVVLNLILLGYYKYIDFFINEINSTFALGLEPAKVILPLGISFYTFTQIAFLVDVRRGVVKEFNLYRYILFVTYFPHLIAGPILHHKQMMPQFALDNNKKISTKNISLGITIFVIGLTKKIIFADNLGLCATPVFDAAKNGTVLSILEAWSGSIAYTLQLYFDFSGYTDMAIGLSLLFNIKLPLNFNSPYKSKNIIDFWRRWHITLSTFLRDYLYIPLGGNRCSIVRRYINLMITMILGGFWHGAGWTFIIWGGLHGLYLVVNHLWRHAKIKLNINVNAKIALSFSQLLTFLAVVIAWVFFRADSYETAISILKSMVGANGISIPATLEHLRSMPVISYFMNHTQFKGIYPNQLFLYSNALVFTILSIGLFIVFCFPNTHQIMRNYSTCWEDLNSISVESNTEYKKIYKVMVWKDSRVIAIVTGILFFVILIMMSNNQHSEFLYYQF